MTDELHPKPPRPAREFKAVPPAVADELGANEWLADLRSRQRDADTAHAHFVDAANAYGEHSGEGKVIRTNVAYKMEQLKAQQESLKGLEDEEKHLQKTRDALKAKIEKVMGKKMDFATSRLKRVQQELNKTEAKFQKLNTTHEEARAESLEKLKEKKDAKKALKEANKELAEKQAAQQEAAKAFFNARMAASKDVQGYHVLVTELKGAQTALSEQRLRTKRMKKSVKRLQSILDMEMGKLEKAFKFGEMRLENKRKREVEEINETEAEMNSSKVAFHTWQETQQERKAQKDEKKQSYNKQAEDYRHQRQDILEGAWAKAGAKAQAEYGPSSPDWAWNDWTWTGPDEGEAVLADASLDEASEDTAKEENKDGKQEGKEEAAEGAEASGEEKAEEEGGEQEATEEEGGAEGGEEGGDATADEAEKAADAAEAAFAASPA